MPDTRARLGAGAALGALMVATFCFVTSENLPAGLLALIANDLHSSLSVVGLLVTGYGLTVAAVSVPLTRATRAIPRRTLLTGLLGVFVLATLGSALAPQVAPLMASRVVSALTHAVFWAIAVVTAAGLFPPRVRGRVVAAVFAASSVATVLGVPAGTWLGEKVSWRAAFVGLAVLGLLAMVAIALLLPNTAAEQSNVAAAAEPDRQRYTILLASNALAVTGLTVASTYIVPFLMQVSGFSGDAMGPLLLVRGVAGIVALTAAGRWLDRRPRDALIMPTAVLALALLALYALGASPVVAVIALAVSGAGMFAMIAAFAGRVLQVAPGRTDVASAGLSAVFNASIAAGALIGALLLPTFGLRSTALVAAILVGAAAGLLRLEPRPVADLQGVRAGEG
jgi:DHA1 family inner membrane transport protein